MIPVPVMTYDRDVRYADALLARASASFASSSGSARLGATQSVGRNYVVYGTLCSFVLAPSIATLL